MTKSIVLKLLENRDWVCGICGVSLTEEIAQLKKYYEQPNGVKHTIKRKKINIDIDHIFPRSKGGVSELFNLQLTHSTCNNAKGSDVHSSRLTSHPTVIYLEVR